MKITICVFVLLFGTLTNASSYNCAITKFSPNNKELNLGNIEIKKDIDFSIQKKSEGLLYKINYQSNINPDTQLKEEFIEINLEADSTNFTNDNQAVSSMVLGAGPLPNYFYLKLRQAGSTNINNIVAEMTCALK